MVVRVHFYLLASLSVFALVYCDPLVLTVEDFQSSIDSKEPYFVKFFAPWYTMCGHCKNLAPTWDKLAGHYGGTSVHIAKVDCTVETKICADQEVKGYPTLKLFNDGTVSDHRGARDIDSLIDFVTKTIGSAQEIESGPVQLTDSTFDDYITSNPGVHFVKFYAPWCGHCQHLSPTWVDLARHFQHDNSVHISKLDCTQETNTCQVHEVKGYPTLLVFVNGLVVERYTGSRDLKNLIQYVSEISAREAPPVRAVDVLTTDTFGNALKETPNVFVKFYAPWCKHCRNLAPTWDKLAEAVHSTSPDCVIAKVDCTVERELCVDQEVHGYPMLVLFTEGQRKEYKGSRDFDSLVRFVQENS